jgi:hypothetical protein
MGHYWPADTGPLGQKLAEVRDALYKRRGVVRNRDRTNLLLLLIALHENGQDKHAPLRPPHP